MTTKPNEPEALQERVARELCRQAGYDPDGAAGNGYGYGWRSYMHGAAQIVAMFPAQPVADAGGVASDNAVFLDFREALMFTWKRSEPDSEAAKDMFGHSASFTDMAAAVLKIHRQSVAAATAAKDAEIARLREALGMADTAIAEYYRYWTGGETRGSYDGKPERANLWKAGHRIARAALPEAREAGALASDSTSS